MADASTCETCGRYIDGFYAGAAARGVKPVDWKARAISAEAERDALRVRAEKAEAERDALRAELGTARELVAVIEERADHLAGELADRERRLDLVRTFNKKLMKTQPRGGLLRPPWEKKGGGA